MVNDLIFPILPREGKVPVKFDNRVQKIGKITDIKALGEDERAEHDEERRVAGLQEREQHQPSSWEHAGQGNTESQMGTDDSNDLPNSKKDEKKESADHTDEGKIKHLDIYI